MSDATGVLKLFGEFCLLVFRSAGGLRFRKRIAIGVDRSQGYRNQFGGPKYDNKKDGGDYRERSSPHRRKEISHSIRQREWHLVGMIPLLGHVIGNVVNRDHPVGEDQDDEDEDSECEIAQKVHGG